MAKKLYRSRVDRKISGVLGGLAQYLNADPALTRIIFVLIAIFTAVMPMALIYIVAAFIIPNDEQIIDKQ
jgi:phage shock protein C